MTLINKKHNIIFFLAEKCASTSIRIALLAHKDGWVNIKAQPCPYGAWDKWDRDKVNFFGVVRNPYARMVSYWAYWVKIGTENRSFEDFILKRDKKPDHCSLSVWYNGIEFLNVLKFEEFPQTFTALPFVKMIGHTNTSPHTEWKEYYNNPEVVRKVIEWAGDDFENYGYGRLI